jgi:hypothetical protein
MENPMKHVEISLMKKDELSIDGQTKPAGNIEILDEMRECVKTTNFSYLPGLIEEAQSLGNRMEAHLYDIKDFNRLHKDIKDLKKKKKNLEKVVKEVSEDDD